MWELASSDGWQRLVCNPKQIIHEAEPILSVELKLSGEFWDPKELIETDRYTLARQVDCVLPNVTMLLNKLVTLDAELAAWMDCRAPIDIVLSPNKYQTLRFQLGPHENLISTREKPVFTLAYYAARLRCEWLLPVDQSCVRSFLEGIQNWRVSSGI